MEKHLWTDTVAGKKRLIVIVDDYDEQTEALFKNWYSNDEDFEVQQLPDTKPGKIQEESSKADDDIWGEDPDAIMFQALEDENVKLVSFPEDADSHWFFMKLVAQNARATLLNIDTYYRYMKSLDSEITNEAFLDACSKLLMQIKQSESVHEDCAKSIKCMPTMGKLFLKRARTQNGLVTYGEYFSTLSKEEQRNQLDSLLTSLIGLFS